MQIEKVIRQHIASALFSLFDLSVSADEIDLQPTRKEFSGNLTLVVFPYLKASKNKPEDTAHAIGEHLQNNADEITSFNVVKGFLNLSISDTVWLNTFCDLLANEKFGQLPRNRQKVLVEYSSPNTNKPLHLGHLRNNFLGYSVSELLKAGGYEVMKCNLVNDRGIHICKSMVAYEMFGEGEEPSEKLKGDKLVGNYYVKFDQVLKQEKAALLAVLQQEDEALKELEDLAETKKQLEAKGKKEKLSEAEKSLVAKIKAVQDKAGKEAPILKKAQETLLKWEAGDEDTVALWKKMNGWVYEGFQASYDLMGVDFDKYYYESDTYLLGKEIVEEGLKKGVFYQKPDGSVWIDLTEHKLDHKLLLRGDGTSVYMTQDMGTADLKYQDFPMDKSLYVVGNEQDYHFKVLQKIMQKLERPYADGIYHLSYGMVDLPSGKMKSREGTVVDADDLIYEMIDTAKLRTQELGKIDDFESEEAEKLYRMLALGALKYYLLKVDSKKTILFNPEESVDFQGNTGVYIQYNHAKIKAIVRKAEAEKIDFSVAAFKGLKALNEVELALIQHLGNYENKLKEAANAYQPALVANYTYDLAKLYSKFYSEVPIFAEEDGQKLAFRIALSLQTANIIAQGMKILGVAVPEKM